MNIFAEIGLFVGGSAIGAAITFIFTKRHYDRVIEKEIIGVEDILKNSKTFNLEKDTKTELKNYSMDIPSENNAKLPFDDAVYIAKESDNKYSSMYSKGSNRFVILDTESFDNLREAIPRYLNYYISDSMLAYSDTDDVVNAEDVIGPMAVKELTPDKDMLHVYDKELNIRYEIYIIKAAYDPDLERQSDI